MIFRSSKLSGAARRTAIEERSRRFFLGTALSVVPVALLTPAYLLLIHSPRFAHSTALGVAVVALLSAIALAGAVMLAKCMWTGPLDLLSATSLGVLLIVLVLGACAVMVVLAARRGAGLTQAGQNSAAGKLCTRVVANRAADQRPAPFDRPEGFI